MNRVVNIDWLEIYAFEDYSIFPANAEYFERQGYTVKRRDYGTPQYKEMFTVFDREHPFLEIRRNPYSTKENGGIFERNSCHIRLCNQTCYDLDPIGKLRAFLVAHGYVYKSISRIDIAMDFQEFDGDVSIEEFCAEYMKGTYTKINQNRLHCHGADEMRGRIMNSFKWGANRSPNNTKLYNKSAEMREVHKKVYIEDVWQQAGFNLAHDTWRIEFSLTSQFQNLKNKKTGEIIKKDLTDYDNPMKLLNQFFIMYERYFDFRKVELLDDGTYQRKDRCPRITLIKPNLAHDVAFTPCRPPKKTTEPGRTVKTLLKKLEEISTDETIDVATRKASTVLISYFLFNSEFDVNFEHYRKYDIIGWNSRMAEAMDYALSHEVRTWSDLNPLLFPYSVSIEKAEQAKAANSELEEWSNKLFFLMENAGMVKKPPF